MGTALGMGLAAARDRLSRVGGRVHHAMWWTRAVTLGVRAIVTDGQSVLLVRHTYVPGWYLPGGGVDRNEAAEDAIVRELREEGGVLCTERPVLYGFHRNGRRDHVACYIVRHFEIGPSDAAWEIAEAVFFPLDKLPEGTTRATRARLEELTTGRVPSAIW